MTCAVCADKVESSLNSQKGMINASVNLSDSSVFIEYEDIVISFNTIRSLVIKMGFDILIEYEELYSVEKLRQPAYNKLKYRNLWAFRYNIIGIPIAAAMAMSSISVVFNSLRLKLIR